MGTLVRWTCFLPLLLLSSPSSAQDDSYRDWGVTTDAHGRPHVWQAEGGTLSLSFLDLQGAPNLVSPSVWKPFHGEVVKESFSLVRRAALLQEPSGGWHIVFVGWTTSAPSYSFLYHACIPTEELTPSSSPRPLEATKVLIRDTPPALINLKYEATSLVRADDPTLLFFRKGRLRSMSLSDLLAGGDSLAAQDGLHGLSDPDVVELPRGHVLALAQEERRDPSGRTRRLVSYVKDKDPADWVRLGPVHDRFVLAFVVTRIRDELLLVTRELVSEGRGPSKPKVRGYLSPLRDPTRWRHAFNYPDLPARKAFELAPGDSRVLYMEEGVLKWAESVQVATRGQGR